MAAEVKPSKSDQDKQTILTKCPRDCYDACSIAVVTRQGKITAVAGDPNHPVSRGRLCKKCTIGYNGVWLDPGARLTQPLRRIGPKGEGRFEPVSRDEAIHAIAEQLQRIVESAGPETILTTHYTGTFALIVAQRRDLQTLVHGNGLYGRYAV